MANNNASLLKKLDEMQERLAVIDQDIIDPDIVSNTTRLIALSKEQGQIRPTVTKYQTYQSVVTQFEDIGCDEFIFVPIKPDIGHLDALADIVF